MPSDRTPQLPKQHTPVGTKPQTPVGKFAPAPEKASRSPCPVVNALANHGHLNRSGKNIYMNELNASMSHVGMSSLLGSVFAVPTYFEFICPARAAIQKPVSFWAKLWQLIRNPYTFFAYFGCWKASQIDEYNGKKYLNLEDLATHGAIEHDISLTRRDIAQKQGNNEVQQDLVKLLLSYSKDGETLTTDDIGEFIKMRIQTQLDENPNLVYGPQAHQINCGQVALMMNCFGDGKSIPVSYVNAIFAEERLPYEEGWSRRYWYPMGLIEFFGAVKKMTTAVGIQF